MSIGCIGRLKTKAVAICRLAHAVKLSVDFFLQSMDTETEIGTSTTLMVNKNIFVSFM